MTMRSAGVSSDIEGAIVRSILLTFDETDGVDATYTCTVPIPAGWSVLDVQVRNRVVWDAATSASLIVGDADDADGYYTATSTKSLPAVITGDPWAYNLRDDGGAYTDGKYYASGGTITAVITTDDNGTHHAGLTDILITITKVTETYGAVKAAA